MTTHPTEADFKKATFAIAPNFLPMMRDSYNKPPWGDMDGGRFSDAAMVTIGARIIPERPSIPEWGDIPEDVREAMVERFMVATHHHTEPMSRAEVREALAETLAPEPARPEWADAPAVLAWHKDDIGCAMKRVWSPVYPTTDTWTTPDGPNVSWSELDGVEPLVRAPEVGQ